MIRQIRGNFARAGAVGWLLVIGWCTRRSAPDQAADIARLPWYCVVCGDSGIADVVLNILLFLPLGVMLRALGWSLKRTFAVALAISIGIEVFQGMLLVGRDACVGDVLSNTLGGTLGWFGFAGLTRLARPTSVFARFGSIATVAVMASLWIATGAGLQPSLTDDAPWIGQPMHAGRGKQPFPGTLHQATIDGINVPNEEMAQRAPWRDSIAIELNATRNSAELFTRGIVLLRIVDTAHTVEVAVDQRGDDAWLRLRLRAADWKLHYPRWLVGHAMRMTPGVPWRFRWTWLPDRFTIVNEPIAGPPNPIISVPLSIGLGWTFIHPFVNQVSGSRLLWTALWLGFWFGLLGWLAGWLGPQNGVLIGLAAIGTYVGVSLSWGMQVQLSEVVVAVGVYGIAMIVALMRRDLSP